MIATQNRSFFDAVVKEPLSLAKAQPHQILLSTGSIALMGQFAGSSGILDPLVGYCIAAGVEWAYLRGLASDSRSPTIWGAILNWSAFGIVVLWGILWVASVTHAIDPHAGGFWGWMLAAAHVVPIAWLSLCSAQAHRAAMIAERAYERQQQDTERARKQQEDADRAAWELAQEEEDRKLARWKDAYAHKQAVKVPAPNASKKMRGDARPESMDADEKKCPKCEAVLAHPQWLAARRWGRCSNCREA